MYNSICPLKNKTNRYLKNIERDNKYVEIN